MTDFLNVKFFLWNMVRFQHDLEVPYFPAFREVRTIFQMRVLIRGTCLGLHVGFPLT